MILGEEKQRSGPRIDTNEHEEGCGSAEGWWGASHEHEGRGMVDVTAFVSTPARGQRP